MFVTCGRSPVRIPYPVFRNRIRLMPIPAACPNGHRFNVGDQLAGKKVKCSTCAAAFVVPAAGAAPAAKSASGVIKKPAAKPGTSRTSPAVKTAPSTPPAKPPAKAPAKSTPAPAGPVDDLEEIADEIEYD